MGRARSDDGTGPLTLYVYFCGGFCGWVSSPLVPSFAFPLHPGDVCFFWLKFSSVYIPVSRTIKRLPVSFLSTWHVSFGLVVPVLSMVLPLLVIRDGNGLVLVCSGPVWVGVLKFNKPCSTFVLFDKKFSILN
jgi:hypothetical protein